MPSAKVQKDHFSQCESKCLYLTFYEKFVIMKREILIHDLLVPRLYVDKEIRKIATAWLTSNGNHGDGIKK